MELKITKGKWRYSKKYNHITTSPPCSVELSKTICNICKYPSFDYSGEESEANAELIADAGNTTNKCGFLPSELLEQRDELLEAVTIFLDLAIHEAGTMLERLSVNERAIFKAKSAIKKTTTKTNIGCADSRACEFAEWIGRHEIEMTCTPNTWWSKDRTIQGTTKDLFQQFENETKQ